MEPLARLLDYKTFAWTLVLDDRLTDARLARHALPHQASSPLCTQQGEIIIQQLVRHMFSGKVWLIQHPATSSNCSTCPRTKNCVLNQMDACQQLPSQFMKIFMRWMCACFYQLRVEPTNNCRQTRSKITSMVFGGVGIFCEVVSGKS